MSCMQVVSTCNHLMIDCQPMIALTVMSFAWQQPLSMPARIACQPHMPARSCAVRILMKQVREDDMLVKALLKAKAPRGGRAELEELQRAVAAASAARVAGDAMQEARALLLAQSTMPTETPLEAAWRQLTDTFDSEGSSARSAAKDAARAEEEGRLKVAVLRLKARGGFAEKTALARAADAAEAAGVSGDVMREARALLDGKKGRVVARPAASPPPTAALAAKRAVAEEAAAKKAAAHQKAAGRAAAQQAAIEKAAAERAAKVAAQQAAIEKAAAERAARAAARQAAAEEAAAERAAGVAAQRQAAAEKAAAQRAAAEKAAAARAAQAVPRSTEGAQATQAEPPQTPLDAAREAQEQLSAAFSRQASALRDAVDGSGGSSRRWPWQAREAEAEAARDAEMQAARAEEEARLKVSVLRLKARGGFAEKTALARAADAAGAAGVSGDVMREARALLDGRPKAPKVAVSQPAAAAAAEAAAAAAEAVEAAEAAEAAVTTATQEAAASQVPEAGEAAAPWATPMETTLGAARREMDKVLLLSRQVSGQARRVSDWIGESRGGLQEAWRQLADVASPFGNGRAARRPAKRRQTAAERVAARAAAEAAAAAAAAAAAEAAAAEAAIAEVEAARSAAEPSPLDAARLKLDASLRAAAARKGALGARGDRRWVASLEAAIGEAVGAGVGGEQLRNARERLADFEAEAALERAEYSVEMATRRANAPSAGVAAVSELVEALGAATAAGADGALVRSARNLVARKGSAQQVEIVKLYDRLDRFRRMAAMSSAAGERENAERMVVQAQQKLAKLTSPQDPA